MKKNLKISLAEIQKAKQVLHMHLPPSPLLLNPWLSEALGCELYLKLESMQPVGSFKIRGATYKISQLSKEERRRGVICASAGNHAQGVAWGSKLLNVKALVVMPKTASLMKMQNTAALGAEVRLEGENYNEAFEFARKLAKKTGRVFVHAFEDDEVIAGQGTLALEILDQLESVDFVIGSIGGGGLMAGVGTVFKELKPSCKVVGCQSEGAPSMIESIKKGRAINLKSVNTFADGIAVKQASEAMRVLLKDRIDKFISVDEEATANAVLTLMEKAKIVVEGSAAISLAAAHQMKDRLKGKKVVLIMCGGNIDVNLLGKIIDRGLIRAGRRVRINVILQDRPGSLAHLTGIIAREGANILQAIHDRSEPSTMISQTEVALTLETRGADHSETVIRALRDHVARLEIMV